MNKRLQYSRYPTQKHHVRMYGVPLMAPDGDLLDLVFGIGHLAHEDVAGGVNAAFGVCIEHYFSFFMGVFVSNERICVIAIWLSLCKRSGCGSS